MARRKRRPAPTAVLNPSYDSGAEGSSQISHEGSFPRYIGPMPPEPYRYDPRAVYNPEDFPPAPPGYGEKGSPAISLEEYKQEQDAVSLPQNPDGSTSYPAQMGPEPPTFHATNVPDTARKWGKQGQDYTFLAESPAAMETAKELGAPKIMRGYEEKPKAQVYGPAPKDGELDELGKFNDFWGHVVRDKGWEEDPTAINPAEVGMRKREELNKKYELELFNRNAGSAEYKKIDKFIEQQAKDAENVAERRRTAAMDVRKEARGFFTDRMKEERKAAEKDEPKSQTRANVEGAQKYTENLLYGPNSWENYQLTDDDLKKMKKDKNWQPENRKIKDRVLTDVNRVRELAGLPPITEKPVEVPMREFRDWGLFRTGEKDAAPGKGYRYEEGQGRSVAAPGQKAGAAKVVRSGMHQGRRVVQYSDGRVEYAPN